MSPAPLKTRPGSRRLPRTLSGEEIEEVLRRNWWGVLATALDGRPYAVPVAFGYDGSAFYIATGPGRKLVTLRANPAACLTVTEVEEGGTSWRSVVVTGEAVPIESLPARLSAFNVLRRQVVHYRKPAPRDAAALATASVLRLVPGEVAGRARDA